MQHLDAIRTWGLPDLLALRTEVLESEAPRPIEITYGQFEQLIEEHLTAVDLRKEMLPSMVGRSSLMRCKIVASGEPRRVRTVHGVVKKATEEGEKLLVTEHEEHRLYIDFFPPRASRREPWLVPFRLYESLTTPQEGFSQLWAWAHGEAVVDTPHAEVA